MILKLNAAEREEVGEVYVGLRDALGAKVNSSASLWAALQSPPEFITTPLHFKVLFYMYWSTFTGKSGSTSTRKSSGFKNWDEACSLVGAYFSRVRGRPESVAENTLSEMARSIRGLLGHDNRQDQPLPSPSRDTIGWEKWVTSDGFGVLFEDGWVQPPISRRSVTGVTQNNLWPQLKQSRRAVITGDMGTGKSTLAKYLARDTDKQRLLIELGSESPKSLNEKLSASSAVILDGLDEWQYELDDVKKALEAHKLDQVLITTQPFRLRSKAYSLEEWAEFELNPWSPEGRATLVRKVWKDEASQIRVLRALERIEMGVENEEPWGTFLQRPIGVLLAGDAAVSGERIRRAALFALIETRLWERLKLLNGAALLPRIAFRCLESRKRTFSATEFKGLVEQACGSRPGASELAQQMIKCPGFLGNGDDGLLTINLLPLWEHLAGRHIHHEFESFREKLPQLIQVEGLEGAFYEAALQMRTDERFPEVLQVLADAVGANERIGPLQLLSRCVALVPNRLANIAKDEIVSAAARVIQLYSHLEFLANRADTLHDNPMWQVQEDLDCAASLLNRQLRTDRIGAIADARMALVGILQAEIGPIHHYRHDRGHNSHAFLSQQLRNRAAAQLEMKNGKSPPVAGQLRQQVMASADALLDSSRAWFFRQERRTFPKSTQFPAVELRDGHDRDINAVVSLGRLDFATAGDDGVVRCWRHDGEEWRCEAFPDEDRHEDPVWSLASTSSGNLVVSASDDWQMGIWNVQTRRRIPTPKKERGAWVNAIAVLPGDKFAVCGDDDGFLFVWDLKKRAEVQRVWSGHQGWILSIWPKAGGFISTSQDGTVREWRMGDDGVPESIRGIRVNGSHNWVRNAVVRDVDGALITVSLDGYVKMLLPNGEQLSFEAHGASARGIALLGPDQELLATSGDDGLIRIWDHKGQRVASLPGHLDKVRALAVIGNGWQLVSVSSDATIRVWDLSSLADPTGWRSAAPPREGWSVKGMEGIDFVIKGRTLCARRDGSLLATLVVHSDIDEVTLEVGHQVAVADTDGVITTYTLQRGGVSSAVAA